MHDPGGEDVAKWYRLTLPSLLFLPNPPPPRRDVNPEENPHKRTRMSRQGMVNRPDVDGVNLRKTADELSDFVLCGRNEEACVEHESMVDIVDEMESAMGINYYLISQWTVTLPDGSTPHGWIKADYVVES